MPARRFQGLAVAAVLLAAQQPATAAWDESVHPGPAPGAPAARPGLLRRCKLWLQDCFLGYPSEFEAPALGESLYYHYSTHVLNGEAARMVLYDYDFVPGQTVLNYRGRDRLAQIQDLLARNHFPIVIERTLACPPLAEGRRLAVLNELAQCPFPVPAERVLVGPPLANGLQGVEAEIIYSNLLQQTRRGGATLGAVGGGGVGLGGTLSVPPPPPVQP